MSNVIPFPAMPDPSDDEPFTEEHYDGPPVDIRTDATVYTLNEVAYLLDIPRVDVKEELLKGTIPGTPVGDYWLIERAPYEAWLRGLMTDGGAL